METGIVGYLKAGYSHFYVQTEEISRAVEQVTKELKGYLGEDNKVDVWGLTPDTQDPLEPLVNLDSADPNSAAILKNYHWFLKDEANGISNYDLVQFIQDRLTAYRSKSKRKVVVIVGGSSAGTVLPKELVREFIPLEVGLPNESEIGEVLDYAISVLSQNPKFKTPTKKDKDRLIQAARGMTKQEIENAFFYSVVKMEGRLDPKVIIEQKMKILEETAGIKYVEYSETFENLLGYQQVKKFAKATGSHPMAKGMMLLGPSGTGKSHFCKALAGELGRPMVTVEMAEWFGSLVGETEEKVRRGIASIKAIGDVIVFIDEIEKGLAGTKASGPGGDMNIGHETTQRAMAQWLKFMNDRPDGIYIVATCNNIQGLPPEYVRAERWDTAPFFVGLPNMMEQIEILGYYKGFYEVDGDVKDMIGWSGAEIKACCRIAHIMGSSVDKASEFIVPISKTMEEEIEYLIKWAEGKTLPASEITINGDDGSEERAVEI